MPSYILQDLRANAGNPKAQGILVLFRTAQVARRYLRKYPLLALYLVFYRVIVEWILAVELPWNTEVGPRLRIYHGFGLVVNDGSVIGADVTLRHNVTIGHKEPHGRCPRIEDGVDFGASSVALGDITIGANAVVGAGSVVVRSVEAGERVAGNPAKSLGRRPDEEARDGSDRAHLNRT